MSIGSGLAHSTGIIAESAFGTYVAPTQWQRVNSNGIKKSKTTYQGGGLSAGALAQRGSFRHVVSEAGGGPVVMDVPNKGIGRWLNGLMGGTVTPAQQAATAAYLAEFPITDPIGKFYTIQSGVPDLGGTVRPHTFLGSKIIAAEFTCGVNEPLRVTFDVDCRQVVENETLAAPSFTSTRVFHFAQSDVKLGTYDSEASVDGVRRVTLRIERVSAVDRFYHGAAGLKSQPVINNYQKVTGSFEVDYITKGDFADRFAADTSTALDWIFTGPEIESPYDEQIRFRVPMIFLNGETPTAMGPGVVTTTFPFEAAEDGTNDLAEITTISTDTAL